MQLVSERFAQQFGVAADREIRSLGVSSEQQRTLIRRDVWSRYARGIVAAGGAVQSWNMRAMAGTLSAPNAMLYGPSAARLHGLDGFDRHDAVTVIVPGQTHVLPIPDVTYRYSRHVGAADRHKIGPLAVSILPVTLVQLHSDGLAAAQALDSALRAGFSPKWMHDHFVRWQQPNLVAATAMLELLNERVSARLPRSWFQRLAKLVFAADGIHLVDEHPVHDSRGRLLAELDLAEVDLRVGVECQSWKDHGSPAAQQRDLRRKRMLRQLGWEIVEVWWSDLDRTEDVLADLRLTLAKASRPNEP